MEVKCLVLSALSHDGNVYAIGSEAYLPKAIAEGLEIQKVVQIVSKPNQRKEASAEVVPVVEAVDAVVESPVPTAKKKS
ncbi:MAG: hypothetical protein DDT31_00209 [Syntrophomonadaceae bacterium]|nr:hypothetical protein [Bacillota bacterium]